MKKDNNICLMSSTLDCECTKNIWPKINFFFALAFFYFWHIF
jgi:hypothetical protein